MHHRISFGRRSVPGSWCAGFLLLAATAGVHAQVVLEEVVVEAQKKVETLTETPIAINAITGDKFLGQASFSLQDVARNSPGLSFDTGVTTDIKLRGIGTVTRAASPLRTNIYQDGALMDNPRTAFDAQFDIERYEILRGPQGTLYGKASPTGTINIQTKSPNMSEVDGYVSATRGNRDAYNLQFGVSVPIIDDVLAVRLAGVFDENRASGLRNTLLDTEPMTRSKGGRMVVFYQPTDTFSARLAYNYREKKENPFYAQDGGGFDIEDLELTTNLIERNDARDEFVTLELNYDLSDTISLISVTGYQDQHYWNLQDGDGGDSFVPERQATYIHLEPMIQEDFRIVSTDNDFWDWQLGFFYQRTATRTSVLYNVGDVTPFAATDVLPTFSREDNAIYTHNTFKFTDELNLIVGLRYHDTHSLSNQPTTISVFVPVPTVTSRDAIAEQAQNRSFYSTTGTLKLQYFLSPELMVYGSYDRAYRAGAANLDVRANLPADFAVIDPETADSVEFGIKGDFWDQRGRFGIAIYDQIYKDFQQDIVNLPVWDPNTNRAANLTSLVATAKEVETRGIEGDVSLLLADTWDVNMAVTYNDSKFNDFDNRPCSDPSTPLSPTNLYNTCDASGENLPQAARWSGVLGSNFYVPLNNGMDWYFNVLVNGKTSQLDQLTDERLPGYATADFFTGLRASEDRSWDVSLWVKNAFDKRVVTRVFRAEGSPLSVPGATLPYNQVYSNNPIQVGLTGTYRFE